ncbi:hypothetical protein BDZ94DRAFT_1303884 [Collybia nuda]|uniref:PWWP domain-containing protein n=1 Tax=Collybia nuda TaxID=64659 RepID=A0A9P5YGB8_9AGAR|nr:hypothetical protein BDZ94DRAFT_1303884 [Collybia nuda]
MADRIVRRAAAQRITNYAESDTDDSEKDSPQGKRKKGTATVKYSGKKKTTSLKLKTSSTRPLHASFAGSPTSVSTPLSSRPRPRPVFNKKQDEDPEPEAKTPKIVSPSNGSDGFSSDLTPLSSPIDSYRQTTRPPPLNSQTPQISRSQKRRAAPSPSTPTLPWHLTRDRAWSRAGLGTYVWVLLDKRARVFDPEDTTGRDKERLWWPGKIEHSPAMSPMEIYLFGNAAPGIKYIEIRKPCEYNIQSLNDLLHRPRFDSPTFVIPSDFDGDDLHESPRKKQKRDRGDLEERWSIAVADMVRKKADEEEGSDDLPEVGTLEFKYIPASPTKDAKGTPNGSQKEKTRRKSEIFLDDETNAYLELGAIEVDRWSPPPADDTLTIPGELILAREKRPNTTYWPARILQYVPPKKRSQEPKYLVEFLDGKKLYIPRDIFYTTDEDSFATCEVGTWRSDFMDVLNDSEEETVTDEENRERSPSPIPDNLPPSSVIFTRLGIRQQFVYTKPVLRGILNEGYAPARTRHNKFILGGKARQSVVDEAGLRGKMDPKHVAELQEHLIVWCLRDERRGDFIADEGDEGKGEGSSVNGTLSEPDRIAEDAPDHLCAAQGVLRPSLSPSHSGTDVSSASSPRDVPPLSSYSTMEEIEAPPLSLPSTSGSIADSPRPTPTQLVVDMDLTLDDDVDNPSIPIQGAEPSELPRQRGCGAFEALSKREKNDYCLNVLLPEAILQILLWRAGLRTSIELLSESEENELHDQGDVLINERDWVYDVIRLRMSKIRQLKRTHSMSQGSTSLGPLSVTGRPRRNVGAPKSYQE